MSMQEAEEGLQVWDRLMAKLDIDAFADGIIAHRANVGFRENPHGTDTLSVKRSSWSLGWSKRALSQRTD